jgi:hypothetical protein
MPYGGYGLNGGFGGGSVGGSIAQGLQSGFEMGRQIDADKAAKTQREFENQRQTEADARAQQAADVTAARQGWAASNELIAGHRARGAALAAQYNGQVPEDVAQQYAQEGQGYLDTQKGHLQKIAGYVAAGKQQAQDDATNMAAGQLDPLDPKYPAKQLVHTFTATTRRPITDLLQGPNGEPAPVVQAGEDLHKGIQFGNEGMVLKAANTLFAPELQTGVGQPSPHGGTIIGKQIIKLLPAPPGIAPQDPNAPVDPNAPPDPNAGKVTPVVRVFVREGPAQNEGANYSNEGRTQGAEQLQYGAPPGATGHYDAPITENRSTDPNDPVAHISMADALNRVEQLKATAASIAGDPALRAKIDKGIEEGGTQHNTFLDAYRALGGTMPGVTHEDITKPTLRITKGPNGEVIKQEELTPPAKEVAEKPEKLGPTAQKIADINGATGLSDAEKARAVKINLGLEAKPKAAGTGLGAGATGAGTGGLKKETVDFYATQSIAGDNSWQTGLARGKVGQQLISAVKDRIPTMASELGLSPQDVGTNKAQNAALTKTLADRQKYVTAVEQLNGTLTKQGDLVKSLLNKGGATSGGPLFNKPLNELKTALGDTDFSQLQAAIIGLAREHQRVLTSPMSNAQLHTSAQETGDKLVNPNMTPKQITDIIDNVMKKEAQNGLDQGRSTLEGVRTQMRGLGKSNAAPISADDNALINKYLKK